ncbi:GDP-mannose transporter GONST4 [Dendrobium catenatum]|uniref:GDP-mannose transporter GONST4 n=1 Tax=Dendrobium catenatum TaxID=906689 RepID=A0A2I0W669_9ASPA|nr:GDP-mannose transporter GONST4 [Dendrobium catenatum]
MAESEWNFGFVHDDRGQVDIHQSPFFDVGFDFDDTVEDYLNRILPEAPSHVVSHHLYLYFALSLSFEKPASFTGLGVCRTMPAIKLELAKQYYATSSLVVGYALCSSLLAVINKFAITKFNFPGLLTALQYLSSAAGVWILGKLGFLHHDPFTLEIAKKFLPAATVFYLAIFTNTNLLRHANVDTFIVFRSLTPLLVAIADTAFRKQPCPSKLTFLSLVILLGGAIGYVMTDSAFTLTAYSWAFAYLITITTEMVYIKHMVTNLGLNTWGFVFYNNLLSLMMAPVFMVLTGEYADVLIAVGLGSGAWVDFGTFAAVSLSCVFGLLISFFGFAARKAVSATAFTVTGVVNKFLTVAINVLIWDKHASPFGLACLLFTLAGGILYQQSVTGNTMTSAQHDSAAAKQAKDVAGDSDSDDENQMSSISRKDSNV